MVMIPSGDHQVQPRKEHSKNKNLDDFFIQPPKPAAILADAQSHIHPLR